MGRKAAPRPGRFALAIADAIRGELGKRRISGRAIALQIGVSEKYMRERLGDQLAFSTADVDLICTALGIDTFAFMRAVTESFERLSEQ
jgi:hypothetical protein